MSFACFSHLDPAHRPLFAARQTDELSLVEQLAAGLKAGDEPGHFTDPLFAHRTGCGVIDSILAAIPLNTEARKILLTLADSLIRIDDTASKTRLLSETLSHFNPSSIAPEDEHAVRTLHLLRLAAQLSHIPLLKHLLRLYIENTLRRATRPFLWARDSTDLLSACDPQLRYSFAILSEQANTLEAGEIYLNTLHTALEQTGLKASGLGPWQGFGFSVQLSALYPQLDRLHASRLKTELYPQLLTLAQCASQYDLGLMIDAEAYASSSVILQMLEQLAHEPLLAGWEGLGITVQASHKQALPLIEHLATLARKTHRKLMIRLCKGAFWAHDIAHSQRCGLRSPPVFTQQAHTDLSYLRCAQQLLASGNWLYPQFATHNFQTVQRIEALLQQEDVEFQFCHGMGESLVAHAHANGMTRPWRVHAPVGESAVLLSTQIQRWLQSADALQIRPAHGDLMDLMRQRMPPGLDWADETEVAALETAINDARKHLAVSQSGHDQAARAIMNPADPADVLGFVPDSTKEEIDHALAQASALSWRTTSKAWRAQVLESAADFIESRRGEFLLLLVREAGKTLPAALDEWRSAIALCRKNAQMAQQFAYGDQDDAPHLRNPVIAISASSFPLYFLLGQVSAALAVGQCVLAKPAPETPLIAARAIRCLHEAGVPSATLRILTGEDRVTTTLLASPRCHTVLFAGEDQEAQRLRHLLDRHAQDCALIAEPAQMHCILLGRDILLAQAVRQIMKMMRQPKGWGSPLVCVPTEIADELIEALKSAMSALLLGNPLRLDTEIGPLQNSRASIRLQATLEALREAGCSVWQAPCYLPQNGFFALPTLLELPQAALMPTDLQAPLLGVLRYRQSQLDTLLTQTHKPVLKLHILSRSAAFCEQLTAAIRPAVLEHIEEGSHTLLTHNHTGVVGMENYCENLLNNFKQKELKSQPLQD